MKMKKANLICLFFCAAVGSGNHAVSGGLELDRARPVCKDLAEHGFVSDRERDRDLPSIVNSFSVDSGQGFGLDIEYKFNKRIGIVLSGIFTDMEGTFVYGFEPGEENRFSSDPNTVDFYTINGV